MELWGTSYLLQKTTPVGFLGSLGATTHCDGSGLIRLSFCREDKVLDVRDDGSVIEFVMSWEVVLQLVPLLHILVLQNRLLRLEEPILPSPSPEKRFLSVWGRIRAGFFACTWKKDTNGVSYNPALDPEDPKQVELLFSENVAVELISALTEHIARNGIENHLAGRQRPNE